MTVEVEVTTFFEFFYNTDIHIVIHNSFNNMSINS